MRPLPTGVPPHPYRLKCSPPKGHCRSLRALPHGPFSSSIASPEINATSSQSADYIINLVGIQRVWNFRNDVVHSSELAWLTRTIGDGIARRGFFLLMDDRAALLCRDHADPAALKRVTRFAARHSWHARCVDGLLLFAASEKIARGMEDTIRSAAGSQNLAIARRSQASNAAFNNLAKISQSPIPAALPTGLTFPAQGSVREVYTRCARQSQTAPQRNRRTLVHGAEVCPPLIAP